MDPNEITCLSQQLKNFVGQIEDEISNNKLSIMFDHCLQMRKLIEDSSLPSNSDELQDYTQLCIKALEKCTALVNELELFSSNELADDLQTSSIKYLLLPSLLGSLSLLVSTKDFSERSVLMEKAEVYFKDFLLRCRNYELCPNSLQYYEGLVGGSDCEIEKEVSTEEAARQKKIQRYRYKKELNEKEERLKPALDRPECEEYIRDYYFVLIEKFILTVVEDLECVQKEKKILEFFPQKETSSHSHNKKSEEVKPLQPFIITKNAIQKQVFGLGYPSIPVLTIDDFYRQRFEKQIQEQKVNKAKSLQDAANKGEGLNQEEEEVEKERLTEKDDPGALMKARNWDDWKDDNPRGSGNRYNKG